MARGRPRRKSAGAGQRRAPGGRARPAVLCGPAGTGGGNARACGLPVTGARARPRHPARARDRRQSCPACAAWRRRCRRARRLPRRSGCPVERRRSGVEPLSQSSLARGLCAVAQPAPRHNPPPPDCRPAAAAAACPAGRAPPRAARAPRHPPPPVWLAPAAHQACTRPAPIIQE